MCSFPEALSQWGEGSLPQKAFPACLLGSQTASAAQRLLSGQCQQLLGRCLQRRKPKLYVLACNAEILSCPSVQSSELLLMDLSENDVCQQLQEYIVQCHSVVPSALRCVQRATAPAESPVRAKASLHCSSTALACQLFGSK